MKFLRFIVFLKWNRKNIFQVFIALVSALFIYRLWTESTIDSKAEKLISSDSFKESKDSVTDLVRDVANGGMEAIAKAIKDLNDYKDDNGLLNLLSN